MTTDSGAIPLRLTLVVLLLHSTYTEAVAEMDTATGFMSGVEIYSFLLKDTY